ncbi:MAG TPA: hypothetical protein PK294_11470 [Ignavibacteria bacterium]|nr:hypothetical protein [Ignavibacteria bacterium]HQY52643.1 hypothetical protein [Ignavibacteria bacterium]HRB01046.1 hypothetical protein [Ignavibacteria bacterium]
MLHLKYLQQNNLLPSPACGITAVGYLVGYVSCPDNVNGKKREVRIQKNNILCFIRHLLNFKTLNSKIHLKPVYQEKRIFETT